VATGGSPSWPREYGEKKGQVEKVEELAKRKTFLEKPKKKQRTGGQGWGVGGKKSVVKRPRANTSTCQQKVPPVGGI